MIVKRQLIEKRQNIVMLEDDSNSVLYSKGILKNFSECNIDYFGYPDENFFKYIDEKHIDLFIMDINLGQANGIEISEKIISEKRGSIFLFISGFEYEDYDFAPLNGKCIYDFLPKPIDPQCFITVISTLLNIASSYKISFKNPNLVPKKSQVDEMRKHYLKLLEEDKMLIERLKNSQLVI